MPYPTSFHFQVVWNISLGRGTVQLPRAVTTCSHPVPASLPSPWHWQCPANRFIAAQQGQIPHPASPRAGTHWKGMASSSELLPFPPAVVHNLHIVIIIWALQTLHNENSDLTMTWSWPWFLKQLTFFYHQCTEELNFERQNVNFFVRLWGFNTIGEAIFFQCLYILGTGFISRAITQTSLTVVFHLQQHKRAETRDMLYQLK